MTATPHLPRLSQLPPAHRRLLAMVLVAVAVLALAIPLGLKALQGASSSSSSSAASAGEASRGAVTGSGVVGPELAPQADASAGAKAPAADTGTLGAGVAGSVAVIEPKIVRSAWLGIKVTDLTGSAARARVIATDAGGQVTSENVVTSVDPTGGPTGPGGVDPRLESGSSLPTVGVDEARMVLSVPAKALDAVPGRHRHLRRHQVPHRADAGRDQPRARPAHQDDRPPAGHPARERADPPPGRARLADAAPGTAR